MSTPRKNGSYGNAGGSLRKANVQAQFGKSNTQAGETGEKAFKVAIDRSELAGLCSAYYSLKIPNDPSGKGTRYSSDVDVALASGDRLLLIDVKMWAAGTTYWSIFGKPFKGLAPMLKGKEWRLSANMAAALDRYRAHLPGIQVEAIVVFVPTGSGAIPSVGFLKWPGGIKSYGLGDGLHRAKKFLGTENKPVHPRIAGLLGSMLR